MTAPAGIYVHIPFCVQKCLYCDFYSVTDFSILDKFLQSLTHEIALTESSLKFDSLYIGGGTPSVLPAADIGRLIDQIRRHFDLPASAEITIEVNPGTVTPETLAAYRDQGITRLNIGVQSFQDTYLKWLGRIHSADDARNAVRWARSSGFESIGIDLIYGLPEQNRQTWKADLHHAASFYPEHLSCYMLTCEPGTPLDLMRQNQCYTVMDDDYICDLFQTTCADLSALNYTQYEISNFALINSDSLSSNRSRHNQKYWKDVSYLGFGPSAHSYIFPVRYQNHRNIHTYMAELGNGNLPVAETEILTLEQQLIEIIFLGLRTSEGISIRRFEKKSEICFRNIFQDILSDTDLKPLITLTSEHCSLTPQGMLLMDTIAGMFVDRIQTIER